MAVFAAMWSLGHAEADAVTLNQLDKLVAGELAALVSIEDFRWAIAADRLLDGIEAAVRGQRIG
jgi:hypothetical protein